MLSLVSTYMQQKDVFRLQAVSKQSYDKIIPFVMGKESQMPLKVSMAVLQIKKWKNFAQVESEILRGERSLEEQRYSGEGNEMNEGEEEIAFYQYFNGYMMRFDIASEGKHDWDANSPNPFTSAAGLVQNMYFGRAIPVPGRRVYAISGCLDKQNVKDITT